MAIGAVEYPPPTLPWTGVATPIPTENPLRIVNNSGLPELAKL